MTNKIVNPTYPGLQFGEIVVTKQWPTTEMAIRCGFRRARRR
jgi:hypothetical protein